MKSKVALVIFLLLFLSGCGNQAPIETPDQLQTATVFAMDTVMDLAIYGTDTVLEKAKSRISELENLFSVTDEFSEIYRLNHTGSGTVSADTAALLEQSLSLCQRTNGALDISVYPVVRAWGFTTGSYEVPSDETISTLLEHVDYQAIQYDTQSKSASLPNGMEIDLGSVAKGYTSDALIELLRKNGVASALLNLGGNVHALGGKPDGTPWRVAIQDPQSDDYFGVLEIRDQAVVTSGGYERYFEQDGNIYWHIIDPATGYPARNGLLSVTIVGDSGVICDGLSTSLFVMGLENAAAFWRSSDDFEAIFMDENGNITITEGLDGYFSLADSYSQNGLTVLRRD